VNQSPSPDKDPMAYHLLVIQDKQGQWKVDLNAPTLTIGRDSTNNIVLQGEGISRRHAVLKRTPSQEGLRFQLLDGDLAGRPSTNGIIVNKRRCKSRYLKHGDKIIFGRTIEAEYQVVLLTREEYRKQVRSPHHISVLEEPAAANTTTWVPLHKQFPQTAPPQPILQETIAFHKVTPLSSQTLQNETLNDRLNNTLDTTLHTPAQTHEQTNTVQNNTIQNNTIQIPELTNTVTVVPQLVPAPSVKVDWVEMPDLPIFYGREKELAQLHQWILIEKSQLVVIWGSHGVGKTTLGVKFTQTVADHFEYVIWCSLYTAPPLEEVMKRVLNCVGYPSDSPSIALLVDRLRHHRCLWILDTVEALLQEATLAGSFKSGYESYGELFRQVAETSHQSCLLLTSSETTKGLTLMGRNNRTVQLLQLHGLRKEEAQCFFNVQDFSPGEIQEMSRVIDYYQGNPLALKIVASDVEQKFAGSLSAYASRYLDSNRPASDEFYDLLDRQFNRLSLLEQNILFWLAINQETSSDLQLEEDLLPTISSQDLMKAITSLERRAFVEISQGHCFIKGITERYVIDRLIEIAAEELLSQHFTLLRSHALVKATAKEYIRQRQTQMILRPIADLFLTRCGRGQIRSWLEEVLHILHQQDLQLPDYLVGNLLNLMTCLNVDLWGADFSNLMIQQVCLRDMRLQNVNLTGSELCKFTLIDTFGFVLALEFSPDRQIFAIGDTNNTVRLWQMETGALRWTLTGHTNWVTGLSFSSDGSLLASSSADHTIKIWDPSSGQCLKTLTGHTDTVCTIRFSGDAQVLASGSADGTIRIWDIASGQSLMTLSGHSESGNRIRVLAFGPGSKLLISGGEDQIIRIWNVKTGQCLGTLTGHTGWIYSMVMSRHGRILATGSEDGTIKLWDIIQGTCTQTFESSMGAVYSLRFHPQDEQILVSGSENGWIQIWQIHTGDCLKTLKGHTAWVSALDFGFQGHQLVSGGGDQTIRFWDLNLGACIKMWQGYTNWITSLAYSPSGNALVSGSKDRTLRVWNLTSYEQVLSLTVDGSWLESVALDPREQILAAGGDSIIRLWDARTGQSLRELKGHHHRILSVAFSPDGQRLASASYDRTIKIWDPSTGECLNTLTGHTQGIRAVAFHPQEQSQVIASGSEDRTVRLWNSLTGESLYVLEGHQHRVTAVAFDSEGQSLASASEDKTIKLWHTSTGECYCSLAEHQGQVHSVAFSPNGDLLASGGEEGTIRLWDPFTGQCCSVLRGHSGNVYVVVFSPEGRFLASGSQDQTIRLWDLSTGHCCKTLRPLRPYDGLNITGVRGLSESHRLALRALGALDDDRR
jgi:WD40 repeat protein/pSer/pThr/pTyr-binding forkhead associated (FHA) protein